VSLVGILDEEIKRIRSGASAFPKALAVADSEAMPMDKMEGIPTGSPGDFTIDESVQEAPSS
jgi:hypothetical protein